MKKISAIMIVLSTLFLACNAYADITVDGYLADWGVSPAGYSAGASQWTPNAGITYKAEDQNSYYLNPGYGGQAFDAEAMYGKRQNGYLYLAIVTGFPQTGADGYTPGDIALGFEKYGIYTYGIKTSGVNQGMLYKNLNGTSWNTGYWPGISSPTDIKDGEGTLVGGVSFVYAHTYFDLSDPSNDHYVMEMAIPSDYFDSSDWAKNLNVHWTMTCGNDSIDLVVPHTPEPASMSLLGLGLAGLLVRRKRKV